MKYLQTVDSLVQDLTDNLYGEIVTPSVRFVKDTNEVVARKTASDETLEDVNTYMFLTSLVSGAYSGITMDEYVSGLTDGTYSCEYIQNIMENEAFDDTLKKLPYHFCILPTILKSIYTVYGSYDTAEEYLLKAISYESDYNNDVEITFVDSGDSTSSVTVYNDYEQIVSDFDFNEDGVINEEDARIFKSYYKFFPEAVTTYGYNKAKSLLEDGGYSINDVIDCLFGFEEYNEDFDLNGNGSIDEEDMCFFISAYIFGDLGTSESANTARKAQAKAPQATVASSNVCPPPRGRYRTTTTEGGNGGSVIGSAVFNYGAEDLEAKAKNDELWKKYGRNAYKYGWQPVPLPVYDWVAKSWFSFKYEGTITEEEAKRIAETKATMPKEAAQFILEHKPPRWKTFCKLLGIEDLSIIPKPEPPTLRPLL